MSGYTEEQLPDPDRTIVRDAYGMVVAIFTAGARTAVIRGTSRTITEAGFSRTVTSDDRARLLPAPFTPPVDYIWLEAARTSTEPDLIDFALQYLNGAPDVFDGTQKIAGDACYGPVDPDTCTPPVDCHEPVDPDACTRIEGSDFNDYLGLDWTYPDGSIDKAETGQLHCLDCSGFVRMVFGYRAGYPLQKTQGIASAIPRRAHEQITVGPGVLVIADSGARVKEEDFSKLQMGDIVGFNADPGDDPARGPARLDHDGIYLGLDDQEPHRHRFISSRKKPNGPTMGDVHGSSILDCPRPPKPCDTWYYPSAFRAVRRF
jgi:cell wall-associated NlpC family hydrolase